MKHRKARVVVGSSDLRISYSMDSSRQYKSSQGKLPPERCLRLVSWHGPKTIPITPRGKIYAGIERCVVVVRLGVRQRRDVTEASGHKKMKRKIRAGNRSKWKFLIGLKRFHMSKFYWLGGRSERVLIGWGEQCLLTPSQQRECLFA